MTTTAASKGHPKTDRQKEKENELVFSYITLRNIIGFAGMLLPLALYIFADRQGNDKIIEPSISDYYYTSIGDLLVVTLSVLSVFLFTYNGYYWQERTLTNVAAVCGLGIAFSPTASKYERSAYSVHTANDEVASILGQEQHLVFAALFFICISILCLKYFPKTDKTSNRNADGSLTAKGKRNMMYTVCGWIMLGCVVLLVLYFLIPAFSKMMGAFPFIFAMETVAIEAFGIAWITKGETLWHEGEHYITKGLKEVRKALR